MVDATVACALEGTESFDDEWRGARGGRAVAMSAGGPLERRLLLSVLWTKPAVGLGKTPTAVGHLLLPFCIKEGVVHFV